MPATKPLILLAGILVAVIFGVTMQTARATVIPDPVVDEDFTAAPKPAAESITIAGGCFWGIQAVFQHVKGVTEAVSGYAGGTEDMADYTHVSTGKTGHAESVQVTYDPAQITLGQILKIYFSVAHDPTELNYQGPDHGTQYRSAIFFTTLQQKKIAEAYIGQLNTAKVFSSPIVTTLEPLNGFYKAETYHQDYARLHPDNPYIRINDLPKVANLEQQYPSIYKP